MKHRTHAVKMVGVGSGIKCSPEIVARALQEDQHRERFIPLEELLTPWELLQANKAVEARRRQERVAKRAASWKARTDAQVVAEKASKRKARELKQLTRRAADKAAALNKRMKVHGGGLNPTTVAINAYKAAAEVANSTNQAAQKARTLRKALWKGLQKLPGQQRRLVIKDIRLANKAKEEQAGKKRGTGS